MLIVAKEFNSFWVRLCSSDGRTVDTMTASLFGNSTSLRSVVVVVVVDTCRCFRAKTIMKILKKSYTEKTPRMKKI